MVLGGACLVAAPWNGRTGGVLAFLSTGTSSMTERLRRAGPASAGVSSCRTSPWRRAACRTMTSRRRPAGKMGEGLANSRYGSGFTGSGKVSKVGGGGVCLQSSGGGDGTGGSGGQGGPFSREDGEQRDVAAWAARRSCIRRVIA